MAGNPTLETLVREDLGYCCVWFFLTHYRSTSLIAARLGLSQRTIQQWKARAKAGELRCEGREGCLHKRITLAGTPRKLPISSCGRSPSSC